MAKTNPITFERLRDWMGHQWQARMQDVADARRRMEKAREDFEAANVRLQEMPDPDQFRHDYTYAELAAAAEQMGCPDDLLADTAMCPGCSGAGVLTDDPLVLRCENCGGVFTDKPITMAQAIKFVAVHQPLATSVVADDDTFYFDLDIYTEPRTMAGDFRRIHGFADRNTKRVVQVG